MNMALCSVQVDLWKKSGHFEFYAENMFDQMKVREVTSDMKSTMKSFHSFVTRRRPWSCA